MTNEIQLAISCQVTPFEIPPEYVSVKGFK